MQKLKIVIGGVLLLIVSGALVSANVLGLMWLIDQRVQKQIIFYQEKTKEME